VTNGCGADDRLKVHMTFCSHKTLTWNVSTESQDDVETQIDPTASLCKHTQRRKDDRAQHLTTFSTSRRHRSVLSQLLLNQLPGSLLAIGRRQGFKVLETTQSLRFQWKILKSNGHVTQIFEECCRSGRLSVSRKGYLANVCYVGCLLFSY